MPLVGHAQGMPRRAPPLEFVPRALGHGRAQGHVQVLRRSTISTRLESLYCQQYDTTNSTTAIFLLNTIGLP